MELMLLFLLGFIFWGMTVAIIGWATEQSFPGEIYPTSPQAAPVKLLECQRRLLNQLTSAFFSFDRRLDRPRCTTEVLTWASLFNLRIQRRNSLPMCSAVVRLTVRKMSYFTSVKSFFEWTIVLVFKGNCFFIITFFITIRLKGCQDFFWMMRNKV